MVCCADLASALWLTLATYLKWPVSTTHSIIGAIIGFSLAYGGADGINWNKVGLIVASWFASPLIAGIFSLSIFTLIKEFVFETENPYERTARIFPVLTFITFFINSLFIIYKGSPQLDLDDMPVGDSIGISFGIASGTGLIAWFIYVPYAKRQVERTTNPDIGLNETEIKNNDEIDDQRTNSYTNALTIENTVAESSTDEQLINETESSIIENGDGNNDNGNDNNNDMTMTMTITMNNDNDNDIEYHTKRIKELQSSRDNSLIEKLHENAYEIDEKSDKLCSWLQIFTSCFSSFAHGSNDVANAVAPLATIYSIYQYNEVREETVVPIWVLVLGGAGIVIGLATWGYKIIDRIGRELTKVSPSRGFIIELSATITVIIASS